MPREQVNYGCYESWLSFDEALRIVILLMYNSNILFKRLYTVKV